MSIPARSDTRVGSGLLILEESVVAKVLSTINAGWDIASSDSSVSPSHYEVEITERLRDGMRRALNAGEEPGQRTLVVLPGTESMSSPNLAAPDGRTDIPIMVSEVFQESGDHDPHAVIECKRLSGGNAGLCREYVVSGIDRFTGGKYGRNHRIGFMVGYLVDGTSKHSRDGVNRYLTNKGRESERLNPSSLIPACWAWSSTHPRSRGNVDIDLHHAHLPLESGA